MIGGEGEEQQAMAGPGREKSSFAVTCGLLSQYLKDKKGGLRGLAMAPPPPAGAGVFRPRTTMNLLSALDAPADPGDAAATTATARTPDSAVELSPGEEKAARTEPPVLAALTDRHNGESAREGAKEGAQQLTIFYGGKVVVFDNFPATKVEELLQMVNGGHSRDRGRASSNAASQQNLLTPSHNLSDMPIARRNSLHRFLEKRKGRIIAKAPYQVDTSVEASNKQATGEKSWLVLGQEATVKQGI